MGHTEYQRNGDTYVYDITTERGSGHANPIREGLDGFGLLETKRHGIPQRIMDASPTARLKCLAGLMDSDGRYSITKNAYEFRQYHPDHEQIVVTARRLAMSVGISVGDMVVKRKYSELGQKWTTMFSIELNAGCEKLNPYI